MQRDFAWAASALMCVVLGAAVSADRVRCVALSVVAIGTCVLSGCASVSTSLEATTIRHSWLSILGIAAIGVCLAVCGVGIARESLARSRAPSRRRRTARAKFNSTGGVVFGGAVFVGGLSVLVLGVPSAFLSTVRVYSDRVVFQDSTAWWSNAAVEIPFSTISSIHVEMEEVPVRTWRNRDKEYLIINGSPSVRKRMVSMVKAAGPVINEAWEQYRAGQGHVATAQPMAGEVLERWPAGALPQPDIPAPPSGLAAPSPPALPQLSHAVANREVATTGDYDGPGFVPSSGRPVTDETELVPGMIVQVRYGSAWYPADLLDVLPDGQVRIHYRGWSSTWDTTVPRSDVQLAPEHVPQPATAGRSASTDVTPAAPTQTIDDSGLTPVDRIGRLAVGKTALVPRNDGFYAADILQAYQEGQLKVRVTGDKSNDVLFVPAAAARPTSSATLARPGEGPGREIADAGELEAGMTLLGHYDGDWYPVEVLRVGDPDWTVIRWEGEQQSEYVPNSSLRIPK